MDQINEFDDMILGAAYLGDKFYKHLKKKRMLKNRRKNKIKHENITPLDVYVDYIQEDMNVIQEGKKGLIAAAIIAALIIGHDIKHAIDKNKIERTIQDNMHRINPIIDKNIEQLNNKIYAIGLSLYKDITTKYKESYQYWGVIAKKDVEKIKDKSHYLERTREIIRKCLYAVVAKNEKYLKGYLNNYFDIAPANDDVGDNLPEFTDISDDQTPEESPTYQKWEKIYHASLDRITIANKQVASILNFMITQIIQVFKKHALNESGFEHKPKGWTDDSVKKAGKTLAHTVGKKSPTSKDFFDRCVARMRGKVRSPEGYCAALKDEAHGSTYWRGKDKTPKEAKADVRKHQNV